MRSAQVVLPSMVAVAALFTASCGSSPDYSEVCVNERNERVDDDRCPQPGYAGGGYHPVYIPYDRPAPAVGQPVVGGTSARPPGTAVKVPRGGFGGRGGGGGG